MKNAPSAAPHYLKEFRSRTKLAIEFHKLLEGTSNYIYKTADGREWHWVHQEMDFASEDKALWVSMGSSSERENLLFDTNSPCIKKIREQAIAQSHGKSVRAILETISALVDNLTAIEGTPRHIREEELESELDQFLITAGGKDVTMDELIERKFLVCRHKALIAAFLMGELVKEKILPPGEVFHYRSELREEPKQRLALTRRRPLKKPPTLFHGVHCWANYFELSGNQDLWMCDPRWQSVINVEEEMKTAMMKYGKPTILNMLHHLPVTNDKAKSAAQSDPLGAMPSAQPTSKAIPLPRSYSPYFKHIGNRLPIVSPSAIPETTARACDLSPC